ncbi:DUF6414 family protein [Brevibacterium casei]|uniref:DUF6414 family protein n=1 Tax=Brevibacterium casei TaxID=33889 RepID=UPI0011A87C6D|nr:hypothetical protein [Brevibacterium casei]
MPYIEPVYLKRDALFSRAEYAGIQLPPQSVEIQERDLREKGLNGTVGASGVGFGAKGAKSVEVQKTYSLESRDYAVVSKIVDDLFDKEEAFICTPETPLKRGDFVAIEGRFQMTNASRIGRFTDIIRSAFNDSDLDITSEDELADIPPAAISELKDVLLGNALPRIPILTQSHPADHLPTVYASFEPNHYVNAASTDRIVGEMTVLGKVTALVDDDPKEGYLSAEHWLFPHYDEILRRHLMVKADEMVEGFAAVFELGDDLPTAQHYLTGPGIVIDVVAAY